MFRVSVCSKQSRCLIYLRDEGALESVGSILHGLMILYVEIVGGVSLIIGTASNTSPITVYAHLH